MKEICAADIENVIRDAVNDIIKHAQTHTDPNCILCNFYASLYVHSMQKFREPELKGTAVIYGR